MSEVPVLVSDLEGLQRLLLTVTNMLTAQDLVDQYRKLDNRNRRSPLVIAVSHEVDKIAAYITQADIEEDPIDE